MGKFRWIRPRLVMAGLGLGLALGLGLSFANREINHWITDGHFQQMLEKETSKGLKLTARYRGLERVGWLGMHADSFQGTDGQKTIVSMDVHEISGVFNPLGFFLQRWEIDSLHGHTGSVMLQKTEATPGKAPGRPWWGWFWPYRVHLADVKIDDASILWKLKEKESGIYHTFLEITPNGHDFEYDAVGGDFRTPLSPAMTVRHAHVLIRKPRLYCSDFFLGDDVAHPDRGIRANGEAGLQEDRSIKLKIDVNELSITPWFPKNLQDHVHGLASGHFAYTSSGTGLETAEGEGKITIAGLVLHQLPPLEKYFTLTDTPNPGDLTLKTCQVDIRFKEGSITAQNIRMECEGVFRIEGTLTVAKDGALNGTIELGLTELYLKWLPTAKSAIFTRDDGPYHFAKIHVSGTAKKPEQDLTPRVTHEVAKSPSVAIKLFFNQAAEWFDFD